MVDKPHPLAGNTCRCGRGKASAYDGKCGNCRTQKERKAVQRMRDGWTRAEAELGWQDPRTRGFRNLDHDQRTS